ncbi:MAG: FHA domain-containing protein [Lachnospiraceae bacterium]
MKSSFIKEYIFGIIQAIIWIVIGTLSILLVQQNTELYMQILVIAADIVLVAAAELGLTFMKNKRMPDQYEVKGNAQMLQQGNREQAAVVRQQVNPLDQVPISAQKKGMPAMARISYVALIGEQGNELLKWSLEGKTAIVIGKGTEAEPVDIDLSGSAMAQMISKQHAVLNYTDNGWYVDDIDSRNGTRVKKKNQSALLDVKLVGAVEVEAGDIIYIANAMLQL